MLPEILCHGELAIEAGGLKDDADPPADRACLPRDVEPKDLDRAGLHGNQRREQAKERRLAAAVGADNGEDLACIDRQVQAGEGHAVAVAMPDLRDADSGLNHDDDSEVLKTPSRTTASRQRRHAALSMMAAFGCGQ